MNPCAACCALQANDAMHSNHAKRQGHRGGMGKPSASVPRAQGRGAQPVHPRRPRPEQLQQHAGRILPVRQSSAILRQLSAAAGSQEQQRLQAISGLLAARQQQVRRRQHGASGSQAYCPAGVGVAWWQSCGPCAAVLRVCLPLLCCGISAGNSQWPLAAGMLMCLQTLCCSCCLASGCGQRSDDCDLQRPFGSLSQQGPVVPVTGATH